jgi:hypothetical protein
MYTVQYGGNIAEYFAAAAEDYRRATASPRKNLYPLTSIQKLPRWFEGRDRTKREADLYCFATLLLSNSAAACAPFRL